MRARDFLKENIDKTDIHAIVKKFLPFVQQHLELSDLPEIELLDQPLEGTFGRYGGGQIRVMAHGRHPIDVLRTLAHELVHYKQDSEGRIHDDSGETGSDEENEANAVAGIIMRDFDQANPELLAALKESRVTAGRINEFAPNGFGGFEDDNRVPMHFIVQKELYNRRARWKKTWTISGVKLFTTKLEAIHAAEKFNKLDPNREYKYGGTQLVDVDIDENKQGMAEGAMSDLDLDIQDEHWDGIVGYVIHGLKTGISAGRMELYLYKWAGQEMFDLDEELRGRGFDSLSELVDHIQSHGGKYGNPTFDLDSLFGDDLDEQVVDEWSNTDSGIKQDLESRGYTFLDDGVDQSAYIEPGTGWVLKIFGTQKSAKFKGKDGKPMFSRDHQMFFKWADYCMNNASNPFLPRFGGFESFGWKGKTYLQIRQEPLTSAKRHGDLLAEVANWVEKMQVLQGKSTWLKFKKIDGEYPKNEQWTPRLIALMGSEQNARQFYETLNALYKIGMSQGPGWIWDLHRGNFMMRGKTPVIVDPWVLHKSSLWFKEGATASDDYDESSVAENFKDGKNPQDKGDSKRLGVPTKASVTTLRRVAKQGGRKGQLAHWQANMKAGRAKKS
jgi:hypothetical protein